jgi:thermitase
MKSRWIVGLILAAFVLSSSPEVMAAQGDKIVRTKSLTGLPVVNTVCKLLGCQILGALDTPPGSTAPSSLFLVRGLLDNTVNFLLSLLGLATIEEDLQVGIAESRWGNDQATAAVLDQATAAVLDQLWDRTPMTYYGSTAWRSYLTQPAADIVRLRDAHCDLRSTGAGVVSVIDTGVDTDHPTLKLSLVPGYDFTRNVSSGDEKNAVNQATAAVLDGTNWVNGGTAAGVDQATAAVLDDPDHAAFGHGTMVAGMIHLVAPGAKIMPVRAFSANGQGYTSDVIRAIYYSVNKGAKVLNMSFSRPTPSVEMKIALDYAALRGVALVASAGNEGTSAGRYPAAYDNVIGVAATDMNDVRASYSNYGPKVSMAAPGNGVITTYPFGTFAATWGTSFSTPMVSGAAALLVGIQGNASPSQITAAVTRAKKLTSDLGAGRLDTVQAVAYGRSLWPWGASSPVPASCGAGDVDWTEAP